VALDDFEAFCRLLIADNGQPLALEPFQRRMLADHFAGAVETVCLLPKANGKSTVLAARALFEAITQPDAEVIIAAAARDQAQIMLRQAQGFVRRSPGLASRVEVVQREIRSRTLGGRIRVLSSDAHTGDGVIPTLVLVDELHRHRSGELYAILRDGLGKRGGTMITISTAGVRGTGPLWSTRQAALELDAHREGGYLTARSPDGSFVLHEWSLGPDEDADDLEAVKAANPASWISVESLRRRHDSPTTESHDWKRFAANVWTVTDERWLPEGAWEACAATGREIPARERVVLGFDGSRTQDATAIVAVTIDRNPHIELAALWEKEPYDDTWSVPEDEVMDTIRRACKHWRVKEIAADESFWVPQLEKLASERLPVVSFPQRGEGMLQATGRLYELVVAGELSHDGNPDLARHVENCAPKRDPQGRIRVRKSSEEAKIDAAVAAIMAVHRAGALSVRPKTQFIALSSIPD
jgi:phage terminase large subunit-like protein